MLRISAWREPTELALRLHLLPNFTVPVHEPLVEKADVSLRDRLRQTLTRLTALLVPKAPRMPAARESEFPRRYPGPRAGDRR
jgi:hypothetical protein